MMFNRPAYTPDELGQYIQRIETLDRLVEKAKRNWIGTPEGIADKQKAKVIYENYLTALNVSQRAYIAMSERVAK